MRQGRKSSAESARTREAILDAAEALMREEGYAAVTVRKVATRAEVNQGMVYYHFGAMDDLFTELFQRGSEATYRKQVAALSSEQPLWSLWELMQDRSHTALTMEFVALANHRKSIRSVIAESSRKFRRLHGEAAEKALQNQGMDPAARPPLALILLMSSVSRFLLMEESFDISTGHPEMVALVEDRLRELEGARHRDA
ncbi:TetR/AcrR family transcriptional regulator [Actinocorallia aurea]